MPRTQTLLLTAALAAACCGATALAQSGVRTAPPAQSPGAGGEKLKLRAPSDADVAEAEGLCARGDELAGQARAEDALEAYRRALKLYFGIYLGGRASPPGPGAEAAANYREAMRERLKRVPECADGYMRLSNDGTDFGRAQLEALRAHALGFRETDESQVIYLGTETDERAHITYKPEPGYTEDARRGRVNGGVRLRAVLAADGTVKHVLVLKGLPRGLTEQCVAAARRMTFTPAVKNGRPVAQFVVLEYHFSTY